MEPLPPPGKPGGGFAALPAIMAGRSGAAGSTARNFTPAPARPNHVSMTPVRILVDADACPVKDEVYKVAFRRGVPVKVVSNSPIRVPEHELIERVLVSDKYDAADDWIVEQADAKTVVVTGDILLADRCLKAGATVIGPNG